MGTMEKIRYRFIAALVLTIALLLKTCQSQQNTLFNQSPFQRQTPNFQRQQLRQRQQLQLQQPQQQSPFPVNPLAPGINPLQPISPLLPQNIYRNYNQNFVPITAYQNELNYDGSFQYGYAAGDGTTAQAQGYVKNLGLGEAVEAQVVQGSYSYTSPEGTPITVRYIADENGFRAEGAHIPTPPPIPDAIAKSLQFIASSQPYQDGISPNLNPYQTPFRQFSNVLRPGQNQLTPLQLQQQQRFLQQQQNTGQYQPDSQFGYPQTTLQSGSNQFQSTPQGGSQGNFLQQQNLQQQQQQHLNKQQQQGDQQQQQQQQQQQLSTQELRARPNQLVNPFGYNNPYRRFKKSTAKQSTTTD
ncbi:uncharacterized protein [Musca autumnalis]|uniref:uncharacterized protein n=1 Tax=Musca autumnalis TaxID=221902 RepID=UPI003CE8BB14